MCTYKYIHTHMLTLLREGKNLTRCILYSGKRCDAPSSGWAWCCLMCVCMCV